MSNLYQIEKPLISALNISFVRNERKILHNVSLTISPEQIVTIVGPNGAGKTTLLKILLGIILPDTGTVQKKTNIVVSYLAQKIKSDDSMPMTVERLLKLTGKINITEQKNVLAEVGIENLFNADFNSLSGGEMQRVLLARCLLRKPDLLILDEPTQALDFNGSVELYHLLKKIRLKYKCAILIVSHDLHLVMDATDDVICLNHHICCSGKPEVIKDNPLFLSLFPKGKPHDIAFYSHHHDHCHSLNGEERNISK